MPCQNKVSDYDKDDVYKAQVKELTKKVLKPTADAQKAKESRKSGK